MGSVATQLFQVSPEMFEWIQVQALAGPIKGIQRLVPHCLGCVLRIVVLLEGEPSPQSMVLSNLEQVFIKDLPVLCSVHLSLDPDYSPSPCHQKTSSQHDAATTMLHRRGSARCPPDMTLGILVSSDQRILFLMV